MKTTRRSGKLFALFLLLLIGVMLYFFSTAEAFYRFTEQTVQTASALAPRGKVLPSVGATYDNEVRYRKFFITVPGAEKVELRGDFNRWGKDPIWLTSYNKGYFETSVALANGDYKYLFVVDGQEQPDPANQDRQTLEDGREVCIKTVR